MVVKLWLMISSCEDSVNNTCKNSINDRKWSSQSEKKTTARRSSLYHFIIVLVYLKTIYKPLVLTHGCIVSVNSACDPIALCVVYCLKLYWIIWQFIVSFSRHIIVFKFRLQSMPCYLTRNVLPLFLCGLQTHWYNYKCWSVCNGLLTFKLVSFSFNTKETIEWNKELKGAITLKPPVIFGIT